MRAVALAALAATACRDASGPRSYPAERSPTAVRLVGPTHILVIPTYFANSDESTLDRRAFQEYLFGDAPRGHLRRLFAEASGGAFELTGDVSPWVRTDVATGESGPGQLGQSRLADHVIQAIWAADDAVNFGRYDNDGPDGIPNSGDDDGLVDGGVVIVHPELNLTCNNGTGRGPHPHAVTRFGMRDTGEPVVTTDAAHAGGFIAVRAYTIMSATDCTGAQFGHAIMAHELGHTLLGLPDLYHPVAAASQIWAARRWLVGCWELMSAGSWGCATGTPPTQAPGSSLGAWTRTQAGWTTPIDVPLDRETSHELRPVGRGGTVLRLRVSDTEHFLVEYRERAGADASLPGSGVLIYRVRPDLPVLPTTPAAVAAFEYRVMLVEADADSGLVRPEIAGGNRGTASDAFGGLRADFATGTHPSARSSTGEPLAFRIAGITIEPTQHRARLRVMPVPSP